MIRRPPRATRTDPHFPYTTLFRSPPTLRRMTPPHSNINKSAPIDLSPDEKNLRASLPLTGVVRRNSDQTGSRANGTRLIAAGHRSDIGARFAGKLRAPREPSRISTRPGTIGTEETGITEAVVHQSQIKIGRAQSREGERQVGWTSMCDGALKTK